jgi:hypothetical protein
VEDLVVELERESAKTRRMDEEKASLKRKLDRAAPRQSGSSGGINIVEEELKALKVSTIFILYLFNTVAAKNYLQCVQ